MKKLALLSLILLSMSFLGCGFAPFADTDSADTDVADTDDLLVPCDEWEHPSSRDLYSNNLDRTYSLNQGVIVSLSSVPPIAETTINELLSEEEQAANGYTGDKVGFVKVNIPSDGSYTVWITRPAWISPYLNAEDEPIFGGEYLHNCKKQFIEGGYLTAVVFDLKAGLNTLQLSHSPHREIVLTVTKSQTATQ